VGAHARRDCIAEIGIELGVPYVTAEQVYEVCLSSHQTHVVTGKGKKFEDVVRDWIKEDILPLIPESRYERQHSSKESRGRSGKNPLDGVIVSPRHVLGVDIKWSGKAGALQSILNQEMTALSSRYTGFKVGLILVAGPEMPLPESLLKISWLMSVRPDDFASRKAFIQEVTTWRVS